MSKGIFKTSFMGGFKKGDVLNYIDEADKQNRENEEKLKKELSDCKNRIRDLESAKAEHEASIHTLSESLETANAKDLAQMEEIQKLNEEIKARDSGILQKNSEIDALSHEKLLLQQKLDQLIQSAAGKDDKINQLLVRNEELSKAAGNVSKTEDQIARVMLQARKAADATIMEAKQESADILNEAHEKLSALSGEAGNFAGQVLVLKDKLKYFYDLTDGMLERLETTASEMEQQYKKPEDEQAAEDAPVSAEGSGFNFSAGKSTQERNAGAKTDGSN